MKVGEGGLCGGVDGGGGVGGEVPGNGLCTSVPLGKKRRDESEVD